MKLQHISKQVILVLILFYFVVFSIANIALKQNFTKIYVWNDMFEKMKAEQLLTFQLDKLIVPVVWGYIPDVTKEGYFPEGMFQEYGKVFKSIPFASAFKGANGKATCLILSFIQLLGINTTFMEIKRYVQNLQSYHDLQEKFSDVSSNHL